jgi:membrane peptidoglycan carboxypeptidase
MSRFARNIVRLVVVLATTGAFVATALVAIGYSSYRLAQDAASASELKLPDLVTGAAVPSVIYAANGTVMATLRSSLNRQPVSLDQIRPILVQAVLDTEDHSFWDHGGVDVESVVRAALADVNAGEAVQGGSTIAQQLVKSTYLTDQKTMSRKIREAVLAERLEEKYSKSQILDAYLNLVYLGSGAYGVEAASKEYFNEDADKVNLAQAALLAGLIQAPSGYDPLTNPVGARQRRSEVLARMVYYKSITPAQAAAANEVPLPTTVHDAPGVSYTSYGYYVDQVVDQLLDNTALGQTTDERYSALFTGGLKIYTNEVPSLQTYSQHVAVEDIPTSLAHVVAAFAVIDPRTGNVEALVGGPSGSNQFDDAVQGERQPGSGFKLFTLIGALEENYDVYDSILATSPCAVRFPGVALQYGYNLSHLMNNDPGDPNGVVSVVEATALSINCAYLRLAHEVGLQKVIDVAKDMGLSDPTLNPKNPSLVIGTEAVHPIEMAAAYATVADGGVYHAPTFVSKVVDRSGAVIYNGESEGKRVFSDQIADEAIIALRATVQYGTGTAAALPNAEVAGKTGTTENSVDAWFNGITPTLVSSVWIGDPKGEMPMYVDGEEVFGADYPTQIWHDVMAYGLKDVPYTAFPPPDPSLMAPVKYIDSDSLARDDLLSHGGFLRTTCVASGSANPCPTTTTRATTTTRPRPTTTTRPRPTTTVHRTTTSVFVLPPPPTGELTPATTLVPVTRALRMTTTLPVTTPAPVTTTLPPTTPAPVTSAPPITPATTSPPPVTRPQHKKKVPVTTPPPVTTLPPVTTALPVTTTSLVTPPTASSPAATTVPTVPPTTSVPPTSDLGGLRAARADIELRPQGRRDSHQAQRAAGRAKHASRLVRANKASAG